VVFIVFVVCLLPIELVRVGDIRATAKFKITFFFNNTRAGAKSGILATAISFLKRFF
jgi:hypothetical protein